VSNWPQTAVNAANAVNAVNAAGTVHSADCERAQSEREHAICTRQLHVGQQVSPQSRVARGPPRRVRPARRPLCARATPEGGARAARASKWPELFHRPNRPPIGAQKTPPNRPAFTWNRNADSDSLFVGSLCRALPRTSPGRWDPPRSGAE